MNERMTRMALCAVLDAGKLAMVREVATHGVEKVWADLVEGRRGDPARIRAAQALDLDRLADDTLEAGARFLIPGDAEWPEMLAPLDWSDLDGLGGTPLGLWVRGPASLASLASPVAIVGSRASTSYGEHAAAELAADLAGRGHVIVSGGAYGIDTAAHRACLAVGGTTVVTLGCGIDVDYPRSHQQLFSRVAESGLIISEYPPGTTPSKVRFLVRNRLIAALSEFVVVVEAAMRSGAKNTVSWAERCGRVVGAVPGPITSAVSCYPHTLLRGGAVLVRSADDVIEMTSPLQPELPDEPAARAREMDYWPAERVAVFETIPARGVLDLATIALRSGQGIGSCLGELGALESEGFIRQTPRGWQLERLPSRATRPR